MAKAESESAAVAASARAPQGRTPVAQQTLRAPETEAGPTRILRPGSFLDIKV